MSVIRHLCNRRSFLLAAGAAPLALHTGPVLARTPVATPELDQIARYAAARDALREAGQVIVGDFLAGNDAAFAAALSPALRDLFGEHCFRSSRDAGDQSG